MKKTNLHYGSIKKKERVSIMLQLSPNKIATQLSDRIVSNTMYSYKEKDHIRYGLEWGISGFYQIALTLFVGSCLNLFLETLLALCTIASLRIFSGGSHFSRFNHCLIASISIIIGIAYSNYYVWEMIGTRTLPILVFTYPILFLIILIKAPVLFKKKGALSQKQVRKMKYTSIIVALSLMFLSLMIPDKFSIIIWQSLCFQILTLTNFVGKLISIINSLLIKGGKRNVEIT